MHCVRFLLRAALRTWCCTTGLVLVCVVCVVCLDDLLQLPRDPGLCNPPVRQKRHYRRPRRQSNVNVPLRVPRRQFLVRDPQFLEVPLPLLLLPFAFFFLLVLLLLLRRGGSRRRRRRRRCCCCCCCCCGRRHPRQRETKASWQKKKGQQQRPYDLPASAILCGPQVEKTANVLQVDEECEWCGNATHTRPA